MVLSLQLGVCYKALFVGSSLKKSFFFFLDELNWKNSSFDQNLRNSFVDQR